MPKNMAFWCEKLFSTQECKFFLACIWALQAKIFSCSSSKRKYLPVHESRDEVELLLLVVEGEAPAQRLGLPLPGRHEPLDPVQALFFLQQPLKTLQCAVFIYIIMYGYAG